MMDFLQKCYYVYTEKKEIWVTGCCIMQIFPTKVRRRAVFTIGEIGVV